MDTASNYKVAVGIADCPNGAAALAWAAERAQGQSGSVTALTAWNFPTPLMMPLVGVPLVPAEFAENRARKTLNTTRERAVVGDVPIEDRVVMGSTRSVLIEASQDHDLLVLGRSGNNRFKQAWLGSTASYCARSAHCPVAIVRANPLSEQQVTVAVDGSGRSVRALEWALTAYGAEPVLAVFSYEEWELYGMAGDHRVRSEVPDVIEERLVKLVSEAAANADVDAAAVRHEIRRGDPRSTVIDDAQPDELLVLGSHGHSVVVRWLLGSVADYAIHHAPGNVVIWRSAS